MAFTPESWTTRGLCRMFPDINFVPDPFLGEDSLPAKNVCVHCPVRAACDEFGTKQNALGVWGGLDELDRLVRNGLPPMYTCPCRQESEAVPTVLGLVCTTCGSVS